MKKLFLVTTLLIFSFSLVAEETEKLNYELKGFVRNDIWYDTDDNYSAIDGLLFLYPLNNGNGDNGKLNYQSLLSRVGVKVSGPEIWGAKTSSYIEADFSAYSNTNGIRFRQAFVNLGWEKSNLLIGRTWHPLFNTSCFPTVISANTGAPFHAFNRSPQIKYLRKIKNLNVIGTLVFQSDFKNTGPAGGTSDYFKLATQPELVLQLQLKTGGLLSGIAAEYKTLQPRENTTSLIDGTTTYETNEKISTYAINVFLNYSKNKLNVKTSAIYGQNLFESVMLGGYAVSRIDSLTGYEEYTPYNNISLWGNIIYGSKLQVGCFGGYTKNLGTTDNIITDASRLYTRGSDIDHLYRISGFVSYKIKNLQLALELDHTTAAYGQIDFSNKGIVKNTNSISNFKSLLLICYYF